MSDYHEKNFCSISCNSRVFLFFYRRGQLDEQHFIYVKEMTNLKIVPANYFFFSVKINIVSENVSMKGEANLAGALVLVRHCVLRVSRSSLLEQFEVSVAGNSLVTASLQMNCVLTMP